MPRTSIPVSERTHDMLKDVKPDGVTWDHFVLSLLNAYENDGGGQTHDVRLSEEQYQNLVDDISAAAAKNAADELLAQLDASRF